MKLGSVVAFGALFVSQLFAAADERKPNILFIAIDDLNVCLSGMEGETTVATPHLDALAERGVLFANAHCAAPACNPSRTSVMTGLAPYTTGVYLNQQDWRVNQGLKERVTLPQHFKNNGYTVRGGGKLYHAASLSESHYRGLFDPRPWDEYFPSKTMQMPREVTPAKIPTHSNPTFYRGYFDWAMLDIETDEMADAKVVAWAAAHLRAESGSSTPFFLGVGIYRPHIPWYTPRSYFERHPADKVVLPETKADDVADIPEPGLKMRKQGWHQWLVENGKWKDAVRAYNASVSFTDDMVGRLMAALDAGPQAGNTIIVLWSDHGYHLGQKEHWEKFALWEQTTRVPMIVVAPGLTEAKTGTVCHQPVSLLDIYPTLAELSRTPSTAAFDGKSLVPLLKNPALKTGRSVVCTQGKDNHAVRNADWRFIRYADGSEELYDQKKDPKNFRNLAGDEAFTAVKRSLAEGLPASNADADPMLKRHKR